MLTTDDEGDAVMGYASPDVCRLMNLPPSTLNKWASDGLVTPTLLDTNSQNTGQLQIDGSTQAVAKKRSTPFGGPRTNPPTWTAGRGFLNKPQDPTGTTHLEAREYDPNLGRFLSVDPVLDPMDPQQANGYAYALNSPVTSSDPTGLFVPCEGQRCAQAGGGGTYQPKNKAWKKQAKKNLSTYRIKKSIKSFNSGFKIRPKATKATKATKAPAKQAFTSIEGWASSEQSRYDSQRSGFGWGVVKYFSIRSYVEGFEALEAGDTQKGLEKIGLATGQSTAQEGLGRLSTGYTQVGRHGEYSRKALVTKAVVRLTVRGAGWPALAAGTVYDYSFSPQAPYDPDLDRIWLPGVVELSPGGASDARSF